MANPQNVVPINTYTLIILFTVSCYLSSQAQSDVSFAKEFTIQSEVLKEKRQYLVRLPSSYENDYMYSNKRYPVLVLLDADTHFFPVSGLVQALSANDEQIPEMIIVSIRNTDRSRDMTPTETAGNAGGPFIRFIETELLKEIDQRYRTLPFRVLAGHSLGGLFAVDCYLSQRSFHAYIAIDPSLRWANEATLKKAESALAVNRDISSILYTSRSANPFDKNANIQKGITFEKFKTIVDRNTLAAGKFRYEYFESEDHYSIPSISFYKAFLFVFNGFKIPLYDSTIKTTADIVHYYEQFQKRMRADISPPGKLLDQVANYYLGKQQVDQAIALLKANEIYYPNSFTTHHSLGYAYRAKGAIETAVQHYKKSLQLDPDNARVKQILQELNP
jgi:predicted alpha/beta superfamily hydrolase